MAKITNALAPGTVLTHMHSANMLHPDLKPANIISITVTPPNRLLRECRTILWKYSRWMEK